MNEWVEPAMSWLAEMYLLATVVLIAAWLAMRLLRQPARRLLVARSALVSLVLLAPLAAGARGARSRWFQQDAPAGAVARDGTSSVMLCPCADAPALSAEGTATARTGRARAAILVAFAAGSGATVAWLALGVIALARLGGQTAAAPDRLRTLLARVAGDGAPAAPGS